MKKNVINSRGFTLVELLAVIVVLAIVILLALQAVMPALNNAKKQVFALEANGAIEAAQTYYMNQSLAGGDALPVEENKVKCVTILKLIDNGYSDLDPKSYTGRVAVQKKGNNYIYNVSIQKDGTLMVTNAGFQKDGEKYYNKDVNKDNVKDFNDFTGKYDKCPGETGAAEVAW